MRFKNYFQNEIENLKQAMADMEEKVQYQSDERLRDVNEVLENCQTRVSFNPFDLIFKAVKHSDQIRTLLQLPEKYQHCNILTFSDI